MSDQPRKRVRLSSLTDVQKQMGLLYRKHREGELTDSQLTALSTHLNRLHGQMVAVRELDISELLSELRERLVSVEERR